MDVFRYVAYRNEMARSVKPSSEPDPVPARPRVGRPRSESARRAILRAARKLLDEEGLGGVTMERVAARAGVGKPTVYRWWPDRHAVAMAALMEGDEAPRAAPKKAAALALLRHQLRAIVQRFAAGSGRHVATLIAASDSQSELARAFRNHFVLARRAEGLAWIEQARTEGDLRADVDCEVVADQLYGPLFFRLLIGHARLDAGFADALLEHVLRGARA